MGRVAHPVAHRRKQPARSGPENPIDWRVHTDPSRDDFRYESSQTSAVLAGQQQHVRSMFSETNHQLKRRSAILKFMCVFMQILAWIQGREEGPGTTRTLQWLLFFGIRVQAQGCPRHRKGSRL